MKKSILIQIIAILILLSNTEKLFSQSSDSIPNLNGNKVILSSIGRVNLILKKDGIIKNCLITEIHPLYIVFEKESSLHDMMIENIDWIELVNSNALIFGRENKPYIKSIAPQMNVIKNSAIKKDTIVQRQLLKSDSSFVINNNDYSKSIITQKLQADSMEFYFKLGISDSKKYYTGNYAFAGGVVSGVFFPVGWIPEIIIASTPAKQSCFGLEKNPNNNLYKTNSWYKKGYKRAAHSKKAGMVLLGFLAGIASDIIVINIRQRMM